MEFFQPTLSFETKNSIFLSDGDTLKVWKDLKKYQNTKKETQFNIQ